jgi:hypothetical protein
MWSTIKAAPEGVEAIPRRPERGRHGVLACRDLCEATPTLRIVEIVAAASVFASG